MDIFNAENLSVSPFLICPTAFINKETTIIFGSEWVRSEQEEIISNILRLAEGHYCKIIAVVFMHKNKLVVSQVVYTEIKDIRTNRGGLCVIYGGVIMMEAFLSHNDICQSVFAGIHNFINSHFEMNDDLSAIYEMIRLFQRNSSHEDLIKKGSLEILIQEMESKFYVEKKRFTDLLKVRVKSLGISTKIRPFREIEKTNEFWKCIDNNLSTLKGK